MNNDKPYYEKIKPSKMALYIILMLFFLNSYCIIAEACGWQGDGEMSKHWQNPLTNNDGIIISERVDFETIKLPKEMGYGFVVNNSGKAVPYMQATYGREWNSFSDLANYDIEIIISVGLKKEIKELLKVEVESTAMEYFNISISHKNPEVSDAVRFHDLMQRSNNKNIFIFAQSLRHLGINWGLHRFKSGASINYAIKEAEDFGLSESETKTIQLLASKLP